MGLIGNETGHLLECVELYGKHINKSETYRMVRRNIAATSLKILWENLYLVKCYDKINMNILTLSLWENFWWGLIYKSPGPYFILFCPIGPISTLTLYAAQNLLSLLVL